MLLSEFIYLFKYSVSFCRIYLFIFVFIMITVFGCNKLVLKIFDCDDSYAAWGNLVCVTQPWATLLPFTLLLVVMDVNVIFADVIDILPSTLYILLFKLSICFLT